jgi:hypothetical protein
VCSKGEGYKLVSISAPRHVYCQEMRIVLLVVGIVVACFGALWALQGFGVLGGSAMSGKTIWSIIGPIVALVGIVIAGVGARMRK